MNIIKYEFITNNYNFDRKWIHWSRIYEWEYVISYIKNQNFNSLHNTSCGGLNEGDCLHLTFCDEIEKYCKNCLHTDLWGGGYIGTEKKPSKINFEYYDITQPNHKKYDCVLNISTLEHLPSNKIENSFDNLLNQVKDGGDLIITCDYPDVNLEIFDRILSSKCKFSENKITNGYLSVVLIHIKK